MKNEPFCLQITGVKVTTRTWRCPRCPNRTVRRHLMTPIPEQPQWVCQPAVHQRYSKSQSFHTNNVLHSGESLPGTETWPSLLLRYIPIPLLPWGVPLWAAGRQQQQRHLAGPQYERPQKFMAGPDGEQRADALPPNVSCGGDAANWGQRPTGNGVPTAVHPASTAQPTAGTVQGPAPASQGQHRLRVGRETTQLHITQGQRAPRYPGCFRCFIGSERASAVSPGPAQRNRLDTHSIDINSKHRQRGQYRGQYIVPQWNLNNQ